MEFLGVFDTFLAKIHLISSAKGAEISLKAIRKQENMQEPQKITWNPRLNSANESKKHLQSDIWPLKRVIDKI